MRPNSYYRNMNRDKADRIRNLYFNKRMKQTEIARIFGMAQSSVSRIISGEVWV